MKADLRSIRTQDGSTTFYSEEYGETYHSVSGAVDEAFRKYAEPSGVSLLAKKGKVSILDVCFGLGYNTAAALDAIWAANPDCTIEVVGLENDERILRQALLLNPQIKSYGSIKNMVRIGYNYSEPRLVLKIMFGDARAEIKKLDGEFDVIFHDPFSPKKCPELWTEEFFKEERRLISRNGNLTTYSCARLVRENMKKAGFNVFDGPSVGRRAPSTIAKPA